MTRYSIDIETTGLDSSTDEVVTIAAYSEVSQHVWDSVFEKVVLGDFADWWRSCEKTAAQISVMTWNGSEFDFPFLAVRYALRGIVSPFLIDRTSRIGKYGKPMYRFVNLPGQTIPNHLDIAYGYRDLQDLAEAQGVKWSLKSLVDAWIPDEETIRVDFQTQNILDLDRDRRMAYCLNDARLVHVLQNYFGQYLARTVTGMPG